MRSIKLKAIKKCPGAKPGQEFMSNSVEAKALVALGLAKRMDPPAYSQTMPVIASQPHAAPVAPPASAELLISKAVLELAQSAGVDVSAITGTGRDGRVTRADVDTAIAAKPAVTQE